MRATMLCAIAAVAVAINCGAADAAEGICACCGCRACVRKVCVPKMTEKEIVKVCWDYQCEDICVPGPSIRCGVQCHKDDCGCWSHETWKATCAWVKTRRVPVKTEVRRKVPAVEWVVEQRCEACCQAGRRPAGSQTAPPAKAP